MNNKRAKEILSAFYGINAFSQPDEYTPAHIVEDGDTILIKPASRPKRINPIFVFNMVDDGSCSLKRYLEIELMSRGVIVTPLWTYIFVYSDERCCIMRRLTGNGTQTIGEWKTFKEYYVVATSDIPVIYDSDDLFQRHLTHIGIIKPH